MAVLEAGACEIPVVATTECNFPELFQAGGGWECEPELESVTSSLDAALSAPQSERQERGLAARRLIAEKIHVEQRGKDDLGSLLAVLLVNGLAGGEHLGFSN